MDVFRTSRGVVILIFSGVIVAAGVVVALFGPASIPGYDASFTLAWGRDLVGGLPLDFDRPSSPTPHPLALLGGTFAGVAPAGVAIRAATGLTVAVWLTSLTLLCLVTFDLTASRIAVVVAAASAAVSAPLGLLVLGASSDISYCALGLIAVLLTLRGRYSASVAVFMVAALLRPEAVLLALVPLTMSFMDRRHPDSRTAESRAGRVRTTWVFTGCLTLAVVAWLAMGAAGGDPLVGLNSAATNAEVNNDPRGPIVAFTEALPSLATPTSWLTLCAAAIAVIAAALAYRTRTRPARTARVNNRQLRAFPRAVDAQTRATITTGCFVGVAVIAYLAQGLLGTPLVARYLLLPAVLCIALATRCIPLAGRLIRSTRGSWAAATIVAIALVVGAAGANLPGWQDVLSSRQLRAEAFASASELLTTDLARTCAAPVVVRSPAMVAMTALTLERPLRDIVVADQAGAGILLQPLTPEASELAGYGPMTPLTQQQTFPTDAPPRDSNRDWALYSTCQP